jgi:acyl-CoA synthetase (AMP-forming)/AMP-acid ligase II
MHVIELFDRGVRINHNGLAFTGAGGDFTYAESQALSIRISKTMRRLGFGNETRFAVYSPNCGLAMISILGAMRAGGTWCTVNLRYAIDATVDTLKRGECEILFFHSSTSELIPKIRENVPSITTAVCIDRRDDQGEFLFDWIAQADANFEFHEIPEDGNGARMSTGGTTGSPKLILLTNRFMLMCAIGWCMCLNFDIHPVNLAVAPITHAGGVVVLGHLAFGGTNVMMDRANPDLILENIQRYKVTSIFLPPTVIYTLLAHPKVRDCDYQSLRYIISAGAPIAPEKVAEAIKVFGPVVAQGFGQSEAGFPLTFISPQETAEAASNKSKRHRLLSCGRQTVILSAMEVINDEGNILGPNEIGEIVLRGPSIMKGYLDDPEASEEAGKYGWHHTSDVGYRDEDGYFYITDRKRDMIISGGFNIFPFEVEQVLLEHPAVQDCAVIGVPDEKWGEAVKAIVQLVPNSSVNENELITLCKDRVGGMKSPKSIEFWEDLPRTGGTGKILKREIRKRYWGDRQRNVS